MKYIWAIETKAINLNEISQLASFSSFQIISFSFVMFFSCVHYVKNLIIICVGNYWCLLCKSLKKLLYFSSHSETPLGFDSTNFDGIAIPLYSATCKVGHLTGINDNRTPLILFRNVGFKSTKSLELANLSEDRTRGKSNKLLCDSSAFVSHEYKWVTKRNTGETHRLNLVRMKTIGTSHASRQEKNVSDQKTNEVTA